MATTTVNASTSVVLVDTSALTAAQSTYVVLLSSLQTPGRTVTIRDSVGYLSSPQSIVVSTTNNVRFLDGTTRTEIKGPYGYLTVASYSPTAWSIVNSFGFPVAETYGSFQSLTTSTLTTSSLYASGSVSTSAIQTNALTTTSTASVSGLLTTSSLIVGAGPTDPYSVATLAAGNSLGVQGSATISGSTDIGGSTTIGGPLVVTGAGSFGGSVSSLGSLGVGGNLTIGGSLSIPSGSLTTDSLSIASSLTVGGSLSAGSLAISSLSVFSTVSSLYLQTGSLAVADSIQLRTASIQYQNSTFVFSAPISTPSLFTSSIITSTVVTSNLLFRTTVDATAASLLQLSSAVIVNPAGSLIVSSLATNVLTASTLVAPQLGVSSLTTSTLALSGNFLLNGVGYLTAHSALFSTVQANATFTQATYTGQLNTGGITISSLVVSSVIEAPTASTINVQNAFIRNSGGSILTSSLYTQQLYTSSLILQQGALISSNPFLTISSQAIYFDALTLSSLTVSSAVTNTVTTTAIRMGSFTGTTSTSGAYWSVFTQPPGPSQTPINMSTFGGKGDFFQPFTISNVKPSGVGPGDLYPVKLDLKVNIPTPTGEFPGNTGTGISQFFWAGEPNSYLYFVYNTTPSSATNVATQLGLYGTNQTTSFTVPAPSQNIVLPTKGNLTIYGELAGDASVNIQFGNSSNALVTFAEPSTLIEMQNGRLVWNYAFNTTTIENSLNDISTRNLYYFGGLNFTSDPRIKENIRDADLKRCYDIVRTIPLRSYTMRSEYCSTFGVSAAPRLGILANELETPFPHSVRETELAVGTVSSIKTVDTQQLEMAHLGATKLLIGEIAELKATLSTLRGQRGT